MRITFEPITLRRKVKTFCTACAVQLRRSVSATQTVNPFNKTLAGRTKTPDEVYASVAADLDAKCKALELKGTRCKKHG